jgi:Saxitoxin biosynthesis operon protein SxtJ
MAANNSHEDYTREDHVKGSSDRGFGQVFAGFFALTSALSYWKGGVGWHWMLPLAAIFLIAAYAAPSVLAPLNKLWTKLGLLIYKVMNPIVLGLLFFVTIMPIGLLMRAFGKDFLRMKIDRNAKSYWIERTPPGPPPQSMRNQF